MPETVSTSKMPEPKEFKPTVIPVRENYGYLGNYGDALFEAKLNVEKTLSGLQRLIVGHSSIMSYREASISLETIDTPEYIRYQSEITELKENIERFRSDKQRRLDELDIINNKLEEFLQNIIKIHEKNIEEFRDKLSDLTQGTPDYIDTHKKLDDSLLKKELTENKLQKILEDCAVFISNLAEE